MKTFGPEVERTITTDLDLGIVRIEPPLTEPELVAVEPDIACFTGEILKAPCGNIGVGNPDMSHTVRDMALMGIAEVLNTRVLDF